MVIAAVLMALLVIVLIGVGITIAWNLLGLMLMLFIAGIVGWLADLIVPGRLPYGWLGAVLAGLIGSWIGHLILGSLGPRLFGIQIIPALLGAIIVAFVAELLMGTRGGRRGESG